MADFNLLKPLKEDYGTLKNFVDGEWVAPQTERFLDVTDPTSGTVIAKVQLSTTADVDRAIDAANAAYWDWRSTPPIVRARYMFKIKALLDTHHEEIARITTQEHGKAIDEARGETLRAIENVEAAAGVTSMMMGYNLEDGAARNIDETVVRQPLGVFGCIAPFNFPGMVPFWFWPYAVATGNTFIIKASEQTPLTLTRVFEILQDADLPEGVLQLVHGDKEAAGALLESPRVKGITFVGSTPVGKYIYERCGATGKRCIAQAGAKNFLTVMPDAEIDRSIGNMMASFFGCSGQRCLAGSNLMAVGDIYEELKEKFVGAAGKLKVGPGLDESVNTGPVISEASVEKIQRYIQMALDQGATMLLDGRAVKVPGYEDGYFVGPTVLDDCTPEMTHCQEEIFGPVASLIRVKDMEEAIKHTNASPFGNAASIYTQSGRSARTFWYKVQAGNIGVNLGIAAAMAYFPFAGQKDSFFGTMHGQGSDAVQFFTDSKVVITRW
ncbi:MAG: CoA-acylating methylmalonate-semialdehyde dehydrogenase [Actinobacteria bacterium]|nr:CoA-acylating methylmalonate-semialdehyde dehydrogenase [Actinomycetota bacterium]